jgi:hypothetical protein
MFEHEARDGSDCRRLGRSAKTRAQLGFSLPELLIVVPSSARSSRSRFRWSTSRFASPSSAVSDELAVHLRRRGCRGDDSPAVGHDVASIRRTRSRTPTATVKPERSRCRER